MYKIIKQLLLCIPKQPFHKKFYGSSRQTVDIRNIGILAHIDAGKWVFSLNQSLHINELIKFPFN